MDRARWTDAAVAVVVGCVTVVSVLLAGYFFLDAFLLGYPYHGDTAPAIRDAQDLLVFAGMAYLVAVGAGIFAGAFRTPIPFAALVIVLALGAVLANRAETGLRQLPDESGLPPWFLPLGIACALLALAAAWLLHRPSAVLAVATMVAPAVAVAAIVVFTARSDAAREAAREAAAREAAWEAAQAASERVCSHVSSVHVGWIERGLTVPDGRLRAARLKRSAAGDPAWFVVAELEGEGFEGDADVGVWRIDAPGANTPAQFEDHAERRRISAANAFALGVSDVPHAPMDVHASTPLDACRAEVLREAAGG